MKRTAKIGGESTMSASTLTESASSPERDREGILDVFRREHPELAEAMQLAGEATSVLEAYERSQQPLVSYSVGTTTQNVG